MKYLALYRKYRPSRFEEISGQEGVVGVLKNAIKTGRISHAYLFCGPRGTGKTTTATLLAKIIVLIQLMESLVENAKVA